MPPSRLRSRLLVFGFHHPRPLAATQQKAATRLQAGCPCRLHYRPRGKASLVAWTALGLGSWSEAALVEATDTMSRSGPAAFIDLLKD